MLLPVAALSQPTKTFTEKLDGIRTTSKELTKNASTDNASIGQGGVMTNSIPLITVSSRSMSFPLQLQYSSGIKVDQQSGPVGLGWVLPIGSIKRDFGAYYPDYSSTAHEADMYNTLDSLNPSNPLKGKFYTRRVKQPGDTVNGTYVDLSVHQKYLGFDAIAFDNTRTKPLSDMYHISVPGKMSNSFFNDGLINQDHKWQLTEIENWKITDTVKNYVVAQEFSRINEVNLKRDVNNDIYTHTSYASAIGVLPYVKNGFAKMAFGNTSFSPSEEERYVRYDDFESFTVTDENGTSYVFGRALRGQRYVFNDDPYWSNSLGSEPQTRDFDKGSFWKIDYIAEWLLTEIRSVDYVDSNENKIADDGDAGDWIRFEYTDPEKLEPSYLAGTCSQKAEQMVPKYREWSSFSQTDRASSLMRELAYLKKIVTPTQQIDFTISERYDVDHDYFTKPANRVGNSYYYENRKYCTPIGGNITDFDIEYPVETMRYDTIKVKSRLIDPTLYSNENMQTGLIKLNYAAKGSAQELAVSNFLIRNNDKLEKVINGTLIGAPSRPTFSVAEYSNGTDKRGKTTLLGIELYGSTVSAAEKNEYKFEYAYNPSYDEIHKREIVRAYHFPSLRQGSSDNNHVIPFSKADGLIYTYPELVFDNTGASSVANRTNISPYDFLIDFPYQEGTYTFTGESLATISAYATDWRTAPDYALAPNYTQHAVGPIKDMYGYFYIPGYSAAPSAWSLTKITYPTGGEVAFKYEPATFTESPEWNIKSSNLPIITRYNAVAKQRSYIQDAHNRKNANDWHQLYPKKLTSTFELDFPLTYGIRLKEKTTNDKINPIVKLSYEYENGTFTGLPSEYLQNALSGFNQFVTRENHKHSVELQHYFLPPDINSLWSYDYQEKMSDISHTNIALDDYSSVFFYKKIRTKQADNSFTEREYGSALTASTEFPAYNLYCFILGGASSWQSSYTLGGNSLLKSPISLKSEAFFETAATSPYKKTTYTYERTLPVTRDLKFDYNGTQSGMGKVVLWDVWFNYYEPFTNNNSPAETGYTWIHNATHTANLETYSYAAIGEGASNSIEGTSNGYPKWIASKTYLKKEATNYKGFVTENSYTYEQTTGIDQKMVLRETKKQVVNDLSFITRYVYAFEDYAGTTPKFRKLNLFALPSKTTMYLSSVTPTNALSAQVTTYDIALVVPKEKDTYAYETNELEPAAGTFTLPAFSTSDPNWRVAESDVYEYNPAAMPVSARSNQLYSKVVTGNGLTTVKATITGTERPFDATYTGFEDLKRLDHISEWNNQSYLKEDWFTNETTNIEIPAAIKTIDVLDVCDINHTSTVPGPGVPLYLRISVDDVSNLHIGDQVSIIYTTVSNGNTYTTSPVQIEGIQPKSVSSHPNSADLNYYICFTTAPLPNGLATTFTNVKLNHAISVSRLSGSYARTGKYSYKLTSIRAEGNPAKQTPVRPVRIAPMNIASECNIPEGPGGGGEQSRNPAIPASCYWNYQASLWIKSDTDFPPLPAPTVTYTPFSDDATADGIYRRGVVSTSTDQGVRIVCKIWNNTRTSVIEEFAFYPQDLNAAWKQYTVDFSMFKGYERWVEVYVENNRNQVGLPISQYRSVFVDDIIISPKDVKYDYSVADHMGNPTFKINNNDVYMESTFDAKGRNASTLNPYGRVTQQLSYFDKANWTASNNYVTEVKWVAGGLYNTTRYFMDGFGRTKQVQSSDHVRNIRTVSETNIYNTKGQMTQAYKPYYLNYYNLDPKYDQAYAVTTQSVYGSNNAFTEVAYEPKPEPMVSKVYQPRSNTESPIVSWQEEYINTNAVTHTNTSITITYPGGTLLVHQMVNPVGKITRTYMNRLGQVIMEEHQIGMNHNQNADGSVAFTSTDLGFAQTWFYYDGAGRLVASYDPENKKTSYIYNSLGVMIETISPDKGISELRYDKYGQVRFTRNQKDIDATNGNIYATSQFKYVKYDVWGQIIESGVVTVAPNSLGVSTTNPPFPTGNFFNDYTKINNQNYPQATDKFVQVHVKNNYAGTRKLYSSTAVTDQYAYSQHVLNNTTYLYAVGKTDQTTKTYMADGQVAKTTYLYDGLPGTHQITAVYNDMSLAIGKDYANSVNSGSNFKWRTAVDIFGRPTYNTNTFNATNTQVSRNFYDPLGNLLLVGLGTTGITTNPYIDYLSIKKNIREQVVNQMSKNYRVGLTYDAAGNITNQYWSNEKFEPATTSSTKINQYAYTYDKMNRLIGADYMQSTMTSNPFAYYTSLNGVIPVDFNCILDGGVVSLVFNPYYAKFEDNIKNGIDVARSQSSINALKQLESDYIGNNVQYADMSSTQVNDFLAAYLNNCNRNRLSPLEFEYYQAISANDQAHVTALNGATRNPTPAILKYMKILLSTIPWTSPMSCTPNPNATAYGYLQNFPTPTAAANSTKYDAAYWYQKNGNFTVLNRNDDAGVKTQQAYSYQPNTNRLIQASFQLGAASPVSYNYTHDANGNLTVDPKNAVSNIGYSFFDELPVSITNASEQHNYRYFGGTRSVKEISATDREYFIDQVILDQNGAVKSYQTVAGYAVPNVNGTSADYFYQVKDWLGSPHITLNAAGAIQNALDYYPYGKKMPARSWFSTNYEGYRYQFTGHEKDGETNYQYHGARYYDEDLARYMSVDPWADKYANWSTYNYAMNNPTKFIDPTGKGPVNPLTGQRTIVTAWGVSDWEVLDYDASKDGKFSDMNLFRSASWNREGMEDETSWGDDYPTYNKRVFVGKAKDYETILYKNAGIKEKTNGLMGDARISERFLSHQSNFKQLENAAKSGNYIYGEESGDLYKITTVQGQWIKEEANFIEGSDGNWRITSKTHYDVTNYKTEDIYTTIETGYPGESATVMTTKVTYDLKITTTSYDKKGKETVTTTNQKISTTK